MGLSKKAMYLCLFLIAFSFVGCNSTSTENKNQTDKVDINFQGKNNEGNKISEINTTWKGFLDSYMKENSNVTDYNPRQDISEDRKVRVVKTEYRNGYDGRAGFYSYALITNVYDENTGELLTSVGVYNK